MNEDLSLIAPVGYSRSSCGYCGTHGKRSEAKGSTSFGAWAHRLTPHTYKLLIDSGWRRSGAYLYKPDNLRTCCAHQTIRLDPQRYKPSKTQRRALNNLYWQVRPSVAIVPQKAKGRWNAEWDLERIWSGIEGEQEVVYSAAELPPPVPLSHPRSASINASYVTRRLVTTLVPARATDEKFDLYKRYQMAVHGEKEADVTRSGFERFLCGEKVMATTSKAKGRIPYGAYHHEYRLDGKLIAVGVVDVLPGALSSVYLFSDPAYTDWQLGKISTLNEIRLARQLALALDSGQQCTTGFHYYLGYLVPSCPKMRYKAEWKPGEVLDMATSRWHSLDAILPLLDKGIRFGFDEAPESAAHANEGEESSCPLSAHPPAAPKNPLQRSDTSDDDDDDDDARLIPEPAPPGFRSNAQTLQDSELLEASQLQIRGMVLPSKMLIGRLPTPLRENLLDLIGVLGVDVARTALIVL